MSGYAESCSTATATVEPIDDSIDTGSDRFDEHSWHPDRLGEHCTDDTAFDALLSQFEAMVRHYLRAPGFDKDRAREHVIEELGVRESDVERIDALLDLAIQSPMPGRLDSAIDVLSDNRVDLLTYLSQASFALNSLDEDKLYVLIRAAGKRRDSTTAMLTNWSLRHDRPSIRQAAIEALVDVGTLGAIAQIRTIAESDQCESVRRTARECLSDLDEA